jgi:DNA recombination protein RmuC
MQQTLRDSLTRVSEQIEALTKANADRLIQMQTSVRESMDTMQKSNEAKLEEMRLTVDEKLQGTLEKRLGESFKQVSDKLEAVHQGLGAMQNLAGDVGNLQKVLTNVKNRGGWGEAQLGAQLEDMLSPGQYEANVKTKKSSNDLVEFAIKLPGQEDGEFVYCSGGK